MMSNLIILIFIIGVVGVAVIYRDTIKNAFYQKNKNYNELKKMKSLTSGLCQFLVKIYRNNDIQITDALTLYPSSQFSEEYFAKQQFIAINCGDLFDKLQKEEEQELVIKKLREFCAKHVTDKKNISYFITRGGDFVIIDKNLSEVWQW